MKKSILFLMLLVLAGCINKVDPTKVVAKVGSKVYSIDDIDKRIGELDEQVQELFNNKEQKIRLLDQIIDEEVLYQMAKKDGIKRNKEFQDFFENIERQAVINFYVQKTVDDLSDVTQKEVEDFYNQNIDVFSEHEQRNLSHILLAEEAIAKEVAAKLKNGESFEKLAVEFSTDPSAARNGGNLGWQRQNSNLDQKFADAAFSLTRKNQVSAVVQTEFGYHIIKYNDSRDVPAQQLEDVYGNISQQLVNQKKREKFQEILTSGKEVVKIEKMEDNL